MKTILAAALLLCCVGTTAEAERYDQTPLSWSKGQKRLQCENLSQWMQEKAKLAIWAKNKSVRDTERRRAAEWAAIYQAACKD